MPCAKTLLRTENIIEARSTVLTKLIEFCHSLVYEYGSSDKPLCKGRVPRDECDALNFGHLVRRLQKLEIWPGDPKDIVNRMKARSVEEVLGDIEKIRSYEYPCGGGHGNGYYSNHFVSHTVRGFTNTLHNHVQDLNRKDFGVVERSRGHLEAQRQKLKPVKLDPSKFLL